MVTTNTKRAAVSADIFMPKLTLTLTFAEGQEIIIDANSLRPEIRDMAMMHGLKQKLVDAAALSRNTATGLPASVTDKYEAVKRVADRLMSEDGSWNEGRSASDGPVGSGNLLLRAMMKMTGHDETYMKDWLSAKTKEQRAALKKNPRVIAIMAELSAATVVGGVNTDALLEELGIDEEPNNALIDAARGRDAAFEMETAQKTDKKPSARSRKPKLVTTEQE